MNYLVFYTESCSPKVKSFKSLKAAKTFTKRFIETHDDGDHWVDVIIQGEVIETFPNWYGAKR